MKKVEEWMVEWLNLFPDNIANITGYNVRNKPEDCTNKMVKFLKAHPEYNKDTVFAATKKYLQQQEQKGWLYTKQASYFISKLGEPSLLNQFCEQVTKPESEIKVLDVYAPINDFI